MQPKKQGQLHNPDEREKWSVEESQGHDPNCLILLVPMRRMGTNSDLRRRQLSTCDAQKSNWMRRILNCIPMRRMGTRWHLLN
jgi:hypothetical protein